MAVVSLHRRAALFDARWVHGEAVEGGKFAHQEEDNEGSIWSNEACLLELLYLLPIVTSRCPTLLTPGSNLSHPLTLAYFRFGLLRIFDDVCTKKSSNKRTKNSCFLIECKSEISDEDVIACYHL